MKCIEGRIGAVEMKLSPTHTGRSLEILSRRLGAFAGTIGSGRPDDEPDAYLVDGRAVSGADMWKATRRSTTASVPRPPVVARFIAADPLGGPRLAEVRHEALLHQLRAGVHDLKVNTPATATRPPKNAKRSGGKGGKKQLTVDERVKLLHAIAPDFAEQKPLKEIAALFGCSPSAFDKGDYYDKTLKEKREEVWSRKSMKRAGGPDRGRDENRQVVRDNRDHVESYEDVDDHIDATWDERRGGRFAN